MPDHTSLDVRVLDSYNMAVKFPEPPRSELVKVPRDDNGPVVSNWSVTIMQAVELCLRYGLTGVPMFQAYEVFSAIFDRMHVIADRFLVFMPNDEWYDSSWVERKHIFHLVT